MELRQLRIFEAVVRHRTVTDAAIALGMAPSSVSEQIRALEKSLGVALFHRTARGMRLTSAGEHLVSWAHRLLTQAEQARREVTGQRQIVRLGALETIAAAEVPRVLDRLAGRRPDVRVEVRPSMSRDDLFADVIAGRLEAALVLDTGTALGDLGFPAPPAPLAFLDVGTVPLVLVAAPGHPLAGRRGLAPVDLSGQRLLVNAPGCSFSMAADKAIGVGPERIYTGAVPVMRAWAEQGRGISLLPRFAVSDALTSGTLARLDLPAPELSLRLTWHSDREDLPGLRDVLYAASSLPPDPLRERSVISRGSVCRRRRHSFSRPVRDRHPHRPAVDRAPPRPGSAARQFRGDRRRATARAADPQPPADRVQPVVQPAKPVSLVQRRAARPVVCYPDPQGSLAVAQPDRTPAGMAVLGHVGQRLGDHEIRG
jgi:DNA-binding transcriptional LysR family regulator